MVVLLVFLMVVGFVNYMLIMSGRQKAVLLNGIPGIFVNVALAVWLIPDLGATGAAIANGGALCFISVVACIQVRWHLGFHPFSNKMWKPLAAGALAFVGGTVAMDWVSDPTTLSTLGLATCVVGGLYLVGLALLGFDDDDRQMVNRLLRRPGSGAPGPN